MILVYDDLMSKKNIALIAHDNLKPAMVEWAKRNIKKLTKLNICATGTTGMHVEEAIHLPVLKFKSGPLGGDMQIGAKIVEGAIDMVIFLWDPLSPHSHDVDVKALLRIAAVYNTPIACNQATADLLISSFEV